MAARAVSSDIQFEHDVQFYDLDTILADAVGKYVGAGLESGCATIVIATASHRASFDERLSRRGLDIHALKKSGQYVSVDAADTLAQFMDKGWPDEERFVDTVGTLLAATGSRYAR